MTRPPIDARRSAGYSLVEVLAVLLIVGLSAGLVVMSLPPAPPSLEEETRAFAARLRLAADEAIITGAPIGARLTPDGYAFEQRRIGAWAPVLEPPALTARTWSETIEISFERDGERIALVDAAGRRRDEDAPRPAPHIRFDPTGLMPAFQLRVTGPDGAYVIEGAPSGAIDWRRADAAF